MKAKLKKVYSPDVDLNEYWPEDESCFGFLLEAFIGPENELGADSFDFFVCTPKWMEDNNRIEEIIMGRAHIIVFRYELKLIEQRIAQLVGSQSGDSWPEIAQKISRWGHWEFEDYRPATGASL